MKRPIRISDAKKIASETGAEAVVVFAFSEGRFAAASYGATKEKCAAAGRWLDRIVDEMGAGKAPAPDL